MMYYDVIYHLTEEVAKEMAGQWGPERIETVVGRAEIKEIFSAGKKDKSAGLRVTDGYIRKGLDTRPNLGPRQPRPRPSLYMPQP